MRYRNLYWLFVFFTALALTAAAPPFAFCDDNGTDMQLDTGDDKPIQDGPGVTRAVDAQALPELNPDGEPPVIFAFSTQQPYTSGLAGFNEAYYLEMKLGTLNKLDSGQPTDCPDYKNTAISAALADLTPENRRALINVIGLCSGRPRGAQASYNADTQNLAWVPLDMQGTGEYLDLVTDARRVGERIYQVVCGVSENGVTCWEPGDMSTAPLPSRQYELPGGGKFTNNLGIRYDYAGGLHMVGTDESGQLVYVAYTPGANQPIAGTQKILGQASQNQSWAWTQVGVAPDGTAYVAAFNSAEDNLYVFHKAADSADHWFYFVISSSSGAYGKYLDMSVDNKSGNAMLTYLNGEGNLCVMVLAPDGRNRTFSSSRSGNIYSTAAAAGNGYGVALSVTLDTIACRLGAKLEF